MQFFCKEAITVRCNVLRTRSMPTRHGSLHFPPQWQPRVQRSPTTSVPTRKHSAKTTSPKIRTPWTVSKTGGCLLFGKWVFCRNFVAAFFRFKVVATQLHFFQKFFSSSLTFLSAASFHKTALLSHSAASPSFWPLRVPPLPFVLFSVDRQGLLGRQFFPSQLQARLTSV